MRLGGGDTVNATALLACPSTVTTTGPLVASAGTVTAIDVALQLVGVAGVPLKVTVLVSCVVSKFEPAIVTAVPAGPEAGVRLEITGGTVKRIPLLVWPPTVTITFPLVAPAGTVTVMLVADHAVGVAVVPLNLTVLVP